MIEPGGEERVNHVTEPEEASPEMLVRELADILAGGFLRLRGGEANLGGNAPEIEGQVVVTDNTANGSSAINLPK
jgi:hypothetical protein